MGVFVYLGRQVRRRWRSHLAVAVLLGVAGGISLFAIAGARRTQSSYPRFIDAGNASTMSITTTENYNDAQNAALAALPEVVQSRTYVELYVNVLVDGQPDFSQPFESSGTFDGRYFEQDRFAVTSGRMADEDRANEVMVNEFAAEQFGYHVGQRLQLGLYSLEQFTDPNFFADPSPPVVVTDATVVAVGLFPDEVIQDDADRTARMMMTPAYTDEARGYENYGLQGLILRRGDQDIPAVRSFIDANSAAGAAEINITSEATSHAMHAVTPLSIALGAFGGILGLASLALVAQAVSRSLRGTRDERRMLTVFGATRRTVITSSLPGPLLSVLFGAMLAVTLAIVASPAMPIGPVRRVGTNRGIDVDVTVMAVGAAVIVLVLMSWIVLVLWRDTVRFAQPRSAAFARPSRVVSAAAHAHASTPAVMGLRFTVGRDDGARVVSMRSVMSGAVLAITAVTASLTFANSLQTLVHEPRLYGWQWDSAIVAGNGYGNIDEQQATAILAADGAVASWSGTYFGADRLDGAEVQLLGMEPEAAVTPPFLRGRMIEAADEVVLGPATASSLGKDLGDTVVIGQSGDALRVVGIAVFPSIGKVHVAHPSLGDGAIVVPSRVPGYLFDIQGRPVAQALGPQTIIVRYRPGTDPAAELAHLKQTTAPLAGFAGLDVLAVQRPAEIVHAADIGNAPRILAVGLALAAFISLVLGLITSVRSRVRDLSLLRALGFSHRQLAAAVWWHATAIISVGLVAGIPLGVVIGRFAWTQFSDQMNVVARPDVPVGALFVIGIGALLLVNLIAIVPARHAQRVSPARVLRSG
ncbi:MAG: hypothetical protein JWN99_1305 [Ilumatobacteraceae bacterium]|nr:hypothetical protein [Ilumatobacteraceae bacterium]